jgi:hypothetical protein
MCLLIGDTEACDICGCGVGNNYIGILPDFSKEIIGIRYRFNSLISHLGRDGATTYLTTDEMYKTIELWGGWNISNHFRLMASLPYSLDEQSNQGITKSKSGIGDASVSGFYQFINSRKTVMNSQLLVQSLWVGGTIKLPTGQYNPKDKSIISENANLFQLGTGSVDFSFGVMYDVRLQDLGLNLTANYKINTSNQSEYKYGNKFSTNLQAYYKVRVKKLVTIAPNAGILFETAAQDMDHGFTVDISGGNLSLATIGVEAAYKNISFGGNWQTPLSQNLANGIIKANNRFMVHMAFVL